MALPPSSSSSGETLLSSKKPRVWKVTGVPRESRGLGVGIQPLGATLGALTALSLYMEKVPVLEDSRIL
jgi:hypothetical protein